MDHVLGITDDFYATCTYIWFGALKMERDVLSLIEILKDRADCCVKSPSGQPLLRAGEALPDDLRLFYEKCGGVVFDSRYGFEIVEPQEMVLSNPIIVGELCDGDISSEWYIIGKDLEDNYISIDLGQKRLGRCYDSFWDRHGVVGECAIIANSFTDLLWNLMYLQKDNMPYWLREEFDYIGDAYDEY